MQCVRGVAENTALASPLLLQDPGGGSNFVYSFGQPFITAGPGGRGQHRFPDVVPVLVQARVSEAHDIGGYAKLT